MAVRHAVTLDDVHSRHRDVEQYVDEMVGEQVDLVHVEHTTVGSRQQTRVEPHLAAEQRGACVERSDEAVLRGPERQLDERNVTEECSEATASVVFADPFSPRNSTPPMRRSTAAIWSASFASS